MMGELVPVTGIAALGLTPGGAYSTVYVVALAGPVNVTVAPVAMIFVIVRPVGMGQAVWACTANTMAVLSQIRSRSRRSEE
jgi:hypothetical protein